ncbi:hypothetical protein [Labilibaculum filiforme]|nr:hypothetical protein [Labilibaculum filiforme]
MKNYLYILLIFTFTFMSVGFKQNTKSQDRMPIHFGKCIDVLDVIIKKEKGDSIAAYIFFKKNYYLIEDSGYVKCRLREKNIYEYFSDSLNVNKMCISKVKTHSSDFIYR